MRKLFLLAAFLCSISAWGQGPPPDCSSGFCAGVGAPAFSCKAGNKYSQLDAPGTGYSCTGIPPHWVQDAGGGGGASVTLENVYSAPGSFTFAHNLSSLFYQVHCVTRSGGGYAPATYSDTPIDTNDATVTVPAAGDYICSFSAVATLTPDFSVAATPATLTYWPTMTGTQQPTFTINQSAQAGYSGTVTYSTSGLASGMTGAYSPTTITGTGSSTLTLSFPANQAAASTTFTASGTDGSKTHTAGPSITIGNINQGLVECWPMNDGSGSTLADGCGTSNTETLSAGTFTWQSNAGLPGTTALFGGIAYTTGANQTATNFDGTTAFSATAWVNLSATATGQRTILSTLDTASNFKGWEMSALAQTGANYHLAFYLINTFPSNTVNIETTTNLVGGSIHFVAFTYDGSKTAAGSHLYIDGVDAGETVDANTLTASTANTKPVSIGARPGGTDPVNVGIIAYARIYNRALSPTDIANYYAAGAR